MSKLAVAKEATTVRYGPSSTLYAAVGSIDANESVVVHGFENGWYCISYSAGSLLKRGFVPAGTFVDESLLSTDSIITSGCSKTAKTAQSVYTGPIPDNYATAGSVAAGEVVTAFLPTYGDFTYIEYGTGSGTKRGYVPTTQLINSQGKLAIMTSSATVYYGPSTDYVISGSIATNEYCAIIACETPFGSITKWCQIEYISGSSRKRGYIKQGGIVPFSTVSDLPSIGTIYGNAMMLADHTVYTGPSSNFVAAGSVSLNEVVQTIGKTQESSIYNYIEYSTSSGKKRGYVTTASISEEILFPNTMGQATTVYAGPSSTVYAPIGSVASGESVAVVAMENGWFAIDYIALTQMKRGYVPVSSLDNATTLSSAFTEVSFSGYLDQISTYLTILSGPGTNYATNGSVSANEAVSVLSTTNAGYALVEYSSPTGTKRGYVLLTALMGYNRGILGKVNSNTSAYLGADSGFLKSGGVYADEYVIVLDYEPTSKYSTRWYYIEFNSAAGRKRGFIAQDTVTLCGTTASLGQLKTGDHLATAEIDLTVYSGPGSAYATVGSISATERVSVYTGRYYENSYSFIEYCTPSGVKMGYVPASQLSTVSISIPLPNATATIYGTSGTGKHSLRYYRIGTGPNALAIVFAVHGYEDAWAADGLELCKLANQLIDALSAEDAEWKSIWSVYIVPVANPDGITDGYTHNGPGRTTVSTGVDFNRCFPTNFVSSYTARNYTGTQSLLAPEALSLYNTLKEIDRTATTMRLLDIHGWLNTTYGDTELSAPFCAQFGFGNQSVMGGKGYLTRWAISAGISAALIELPFPYSIADISTNDFFVKLNAAVHSIFELEITVPDDQVLYSPGCSGEEVGVLQAYLKYHGYYSADIDEYYGNLTCSAISTFQIANGLPDTGLVTGATLYAMGFASTTGGKITDDCDVYNENLRKEKFYIAYQKTRDTTGNYTIQCGENYIRCLPAKKQLAYSVVNSIPTFSIEDLVGGDTQIYELTAMDNGYKISPKGYDKYSLTANTSTLTVALAIDTGAHTQRWCIETDGDTCCFSIIDCANMYLCSNGHNTSLFLNEEKLLWSCRNVIESRRLPETLKNLGVEITYIKDTPDRSLLDQAREDSGASNILFIYDNYYLDYTVPILAFFDSTHEVCERLGISTSTVIEFVPEVASSGLAFYRKVNDDCEWDIKKPNVWNKAFNEQLPYMSAWNADPQYNNKFIFCGNLRTPEDLGNILYGYTGALFGFGKEILFWCGGAVAVRNSDAFKQYCQENGYEHEGLRGFARALFQDATMEKPLYGDSAEDHYAVLEGFELAEQRTAVPTMVTDLAIDEAISIVEYMKELDSKNT